MCKFFLRPSYWALALVWYLDCKNITDIAYFLCGVYLTSPVGLRIEGLHTLILNFAQLFGSNQNDHDQWYFANSSGMKAWNFWWGSVYKCTHNARFFLQLLKSLKSGKPWLLHIFHLNCDMYNFEQEFNFQLHILYCQAQPQLNWISCSIN